MPRVQLTNGERSWWRPTAQLGKASSQLPATRYTGPILSALRGTSDALGPQPRFRACPNTWFAIASLPTGLREEEMRRLRVARRSGSSWSGRCRDMLLPPKDLAIHTRIVPSRHDRNFNRWFGVATSFFLLGSIVSRKRGQLVAAQSLQTSACGSIPRPAPAAGMAAAPQDTDTERRGRRWELSTSSQKLCDRRYGLPETDHHVGTLSRPQDYPE